MEWINTGRSGAILAMRALVLAGFAGLAVACGGGVPLMGGSTSAQDGRESAAAADGDFRIGGLAPRRLDPAECGLFLWDTGAERRLVFFSRNGAGVAQMLIDGRERDLERLSSDGMVFAGQFTEQTFSVPRAALRVELSIERGPPLEGGESVPDGLLKLIHQSGWEQVISVAGVIGCQPA